MNCVSLFTPHCHKHGAEIALWHPKTGGYTFEELHEIAARTQYVLKGLRIGPGDKVVVRDKLPPRLYGILLGIFATGATGVLLDPQLKPEAVSDALLELDPRIYITSFSGRLVGWKIRALRRLPLWLSAKTTVESSSANLLDLTQVPESTVALLTLTAGENENVSRAQFTHAELSETKPASEAGPDVCLLPNLVMGNLFAGRGSLLLSPVLTEKTIDKLTDIPKFLLPTSVSCSTSDAKTLLPDLPFDTVKTVRIKGEPLESALTEQITTHWPSLQITSA